MSVIGANWESGILSDHITSDEMFEWFCEGGHALSNEDYCAP